MNPYSQFQANENLEALRQNPYPGRGIVLGMDETGRHIVQIYWIMGRSENSRNRIFEEEGGKLLTRPADPSKVQDPSLIIYTAMEEQGNTYVVSNGSQTTPVLYNIECEGKKLISSLKGFQYEPDKPNYTSRITGVCRRCVSHRFGFAWLRKSLWNETCEVGCQYYEHVEPGFGFCITTYSGDGDPLPAFRGEPILLPIRGEMDEILETYWDVLNADNRISLAAKFIAEDGNSFIKIKNKFSKVA